MKRHSTTVKLQLRHRQLRQVLGPLITVTTLAFQ
jgi:hypothetical protein